MPGAPQTARGRAEPIAVQFGVFLANRVGELREMLEILADHDVQVVGMSIVDSSDWAVVRVVLSNADKGRDLLEKHDLPFPETQVLPAENPAPSSLSEICGHLLRAEINIRFAYPLAIRGRRQPVTALHVDDPVLATHALTRHEFVLLGSEDLADPR